MSEKKNLKIVISENGRLLLYRARKLKRQWCPEIEYERCGDHCPLFNEPIFDMGEGVVGIEICRDSLTCSLDEFEDRR